MILYSQVVATYNGKKQLYEPVKGQQIDWDNKDNSPPPDKPKCGYNGNNCPKKGMDLSTLYI